MADSSDTGDFTPSPAPNPRVADHELVTMIGRGSYGEVWLGRNTLGGWRAIKIVYESTFRHRRPFEREFNGVQKFEPVSRLHDGLMDILQVGRNEAGGYFYCIMELADDARTGQQIDPTRYTPRTLAHEIREQKRLAIPECRRIGVAIAGALEFLHGRGLIHRDVKPSNIVFVNGVPKLADIGLVAEMSEAKSYVGTEGFIPPEGPGTVQADIYSFGKVLYEISTGKDRHDYPELPTEMGDPAEEDELFGFHKIVLKACRTNPQERYKLAGEVAVDILSLESGGRSGPSGRAKRRSRARIGALAVIALGLVSGLWFSSLPDEKRAGIQEPPAAIASAKVRPQSGLAAGFSGPISRWRGENSTADATARNHGIAAGSNGVSYGPGMFGQAFVFDGTHRDRIDLGSPDSLRLEDFTIDAWIRRFDLARTSLDAGGADGSTCGGGGAILSYGTGGYSFGLIDDGRMFIGRADMDAVYSTNIAVLDTNWHHAAVTKSGTNVTFYLDAAVEVMSDYYHPSSFTFKTPLAIGSRGDGAGGTFLGMIDELSVYDHALTPAEFQAVRLHEKLAGKRSSLVFPPVGLISSWEAEGDPADWTGVNDGTTHGSMRYAGGIVGRAFDFDGGENWIEVPNRSSLNPTNAITVECWLNRRGSVGKYDPVVRKVGIGSDLPAAGYTLEFLGNEICFAVCNGTSSASSGAPIEFGKWYHVVGVCDGTNVLCYVNGMPAGDPVAVSGTLKPSSNPLRFGREPTDPTRSFDGLLDEVSIYDRALSVDEIQDHYLAHSLEKSVAVGRARR